jgi:HSP20 family protein
MKGQFAVQEAHVPVSPKLVNAESLFERMKEIYNSIGQKAYDFFEKRGYKHGFDIEDWLFAEKELLRAVPVEIKETKTELTIRAEVPGFGPEDLELSIEPNRFIINGKIEKESKKEVKKVTYTELFANEIFRIIELPVEIDPTKVKAELKNGVLFVTMEKALVKEPTKVEVKVI